MGKKVRYTTELWARKRENRYFQILTHLIVPSDFYEPLTEYQPNLKYYFLVQNLLPKEWRILRNGIWFYCFPPFYNKRIQGWKIHVSATTSNAEAILQAAVPVLVKSGVSFKFALDSTILHLLNGKWWPRGASGKFITIYPHSDIQFFYLLKQLYKVLRHFEGPYILSDKRYKDCKVLYYRYGGFEPLETLTTLGSFTAGLVSPDGSFVEDKRNPFFSPPFWVKDPFPDDEAESANEKEIYLNKKRYKVKRAIAISNTGGVYVADDLISNQEIILKEARPFTGIDAISQLKKEARILDKLMQKGYTIAPKVLELFREWEHLFLAEEYVNGIPLTIYVTTKSPVLAIRPSRKDIQHYVNEVCTIVQSVAEAMDILHSLNIVFGDVSPNNIIVLRQKNKLSVKLIDFEGAYELGVDTPVRLFTPGFAAKDRLGHSMPMPEDDWYGLGSLLLFLLFPINPVRDLDENVVWRFLNELKKDFDLPATLIELVHELTAVNVKRRPSFQDVKHKLEQAQNDQKRSLMRERNVNVLARDKKENHFLTAEMLQSTIKNICQYILKQASYSRRDRLFPSDPAKTNPLSVNHGALGVVYALHLMGEEIPKAVFNWIESQEISTAKYSPGLYTGLSGIAWVFSVLGKLDLAVEIWNKAYFHPLLYGEWNIYSGAAGCGLTALHLWLITQEKKFLEQAIVIGETILKAARKNKRGLYWSSESVGYAHGASGIALFLLYLYCVTRDKKFVEYGRRALDFDLSFARKTMDGFLSIPFDQTNTRVLLPYWEVGSAGLGTTVLYYFLITKDERLEPILSGLIGDTMRKYTVFPGLFNGLAGLGNFLLNCYSFLGNPLYLEVAKKTAEGILLFKIEKPDGIAFPGENLYRISTDFATGSAGIGLYLHRLQRLAPDFNFVLDDLITRYLTAESSNDMGEDSAERTGPGKLLLQTA